MDAKEETARKHPCVWCRGRGRAKAEKTAGCVLNGDSHGVGEGKAGGSGTERLVERKDVGANWGKSNLGGK